MVKNKLKPAQLPSLTDAIHFNTIDVDFALKNKKAIRSWIQSTIESEGKEFDFLSYNFCSDTYLLKVNKKHLNHDYYTDIITFDLSEGKIISGDIYISIDRVKENSAASLSKFHVELCRVIIHGILHLCGYKDKSKKDAAMMRGKEDFYLSIL
jgi:probable rRNA maturation factor